MDIPAGDLCKRLVQPVGPALAEKSLGRICRAVAFLSDLIFRVIVQDCLLIGLWAILRLVVAAIPGWVGSLVPNCDPRIPGGLPGQGEA